MGCANVSRSRRSRPQPPTTALSPAFSTSEQEAFATFRLDLPLELRLRYGENPHQHGELYGDFGSYFEKLQGKELSYNNILDISAAAQLISEFTKPAAAILKHTNPCGVGTDADLREAWDKAFATDKRAPFGGIIVCNRPITLALAKAISEIFSEVIIAPGIQPRCALSASPKRKTSG